MGSSLSSELKPGAGCLHQEQDLGVGARSVGVEPGHEPGSFGASEPPPLDQRGEATDGMVLDAGSLALGADGHKLQLHPTIATPVARQRRVTSTPNVTLGRVAAPI